MLKAASKHFENEVGSAVTMSVWATGTAAEVRVLASGPTSQLDHTWTRREAEVLRDLLDHVLRGD